ncbi:hypothetical protein IGI04_010377 [Brassica rapa subsp. trilocularis]|uniref:Uncharacterized protein n=1 Tax=Brassica rapa subsp. trilocularis TaxID=1813537 RepID=A0ABQ7MZY6_BRACM|nr:hypothetical protein IGI04_010377 [Brassica rapa subsp. trilocularis]
MDMWIAINHQGGLHPTRLSGPSISVSGPSTFLPRLDKLKTQSTGAFMSFDQVYLCGQYVLNV